MDSSITMTQLFGFGFLFGMLGGLCRHADFLIELGQKPSPAEGDLAHVSSQKRRIYLMVIRAYQGGIIGLISALLYVTQFGTKNSAEMEYAEIFAISFTVSVLFAEIKARIRNGKSISGDEAS